MRVSKHAKTRLKQRCGVTKKSSVKMARRAYNMGIRHNETKGDLNKWISYLYYKHRSANNIRLYGGKAYIFCKDMLVTVINIPHNLLDNFDSMIKTDEELMETLAKKEFRRRNVRLSDDSVEIVSSSNNFFIQGVVAPILKKR